ncbi:MAG: hypothetical protein ACJAYU_003681 [Bradymonadia bacterium]|jgi:hypothetical protein
MRAERLTPPLEILVMMSSTHSKRIRTVAARIALLVAVSFAVACGGRQQGGGLQDLGFDVGVQNILDLLPSPISYAYITDFDEDDAARMRSQWRSSASGPAFASIVQSQTGYDLTNQEGLAEIGIDLLGEFGIYSTTALPVAIARLSEPMKFEEFLAGYRSRNPDMTWSSFAIADSTFWSTDIEENGDHIASFDLGVVGNYAVLRVRSPIEGSFVDDTALAALIEGTHALSLSSDPRIASLQARADGTISSVGLLDTELFRKVFTFVTSFGEFERPENPNCDSTSDAIAQAVPWAGIVQYRAGDIRRGIHVVQLSEAAAARAAGVLGGTSDETFDAAADSPLFVSWNLNLDAALSLMNGDPRLTGECADLAALSGALGTLNGQVDPVIRDFLRKLTGLFMITLEDLNIAGFIPRVSAGFAIGSANPVPLTEVFQNALTEMGAVGSVDDTAPFTTFEYSILGFTVRISQLLDRMVLATHDVPIGLFNSMAVSEDQNGDFMQMRMLGAPIAEMLREVQRFAIGEITEEAQSQFEAVAASYESINWMTYTLALDSNTIVGTIAVELTPVEEE